MISCQRHKLLTADGACFLTGRDAQGRAEGDSKHVTDQKFVKRLMVGKNAPACPWNFVVVIWWPAQVTTFLLIKIQLNDCENQVNMRLNLQPHNKSFRLKNVRHALQQKGAMKYWIGTLVWLPVILEWYTLDLVVGVKTNAEQQMIHVNLFYFWKCLEWLIMKSA